MVRKFFTLAAVSICLSCSTNAPTSETQPTEQPAVEPAAQVDPLQAAVDSPARTAEDKARDQYRNPAETLRFLGIEPTSSVLELWAGGGWYTAILTPYVAASGKLYATTYAPTGEVEYLRNLTATLTGWLANAEHGDKVTLIEVNPPTQLDLGLENQVDFVLTFRNVHNWVKGGYDNEIYAQAFRALKPGGIFGVIEHRGPAGMTREESIKSGYMDQAQVIADIEAVGFELVETSEINANPKDTKDYPEGVWTLPPRLRLGDVDREKYLAIGESDRMTLKFRKP